MANVWAERGMKIGAFGALYAGSNLLIDWAGKKWGVNTDAKLYEFEDVPQIGDIEIGFDDVAAFFVALFIITRFKK